MLSGTVKFFDSGRRNYGILKYCTPEGEQREIPFYGDGRKAIVLKKGDVRWTHARSRGKLPATGDLITFEVFKRGAVEVKAYPWAPADEYIKALDTKSKRR